ncbi:hypothetical protein NP493_186g03140 [Ridgeia piscesae]|uniref:Uncharacterized protein n=1 Tax=Ridgeia piscesae TaxID=27915 RepID=A0AAD9P2K0_RIDPI|nr:hypothetical protein NP493_186g03140 [Ridgeia piscesae]
MTSSSVCSSSFSLGLLKRRNLHAYRLPEFLSITLRTIPADPLPCPVHPPRGNSPLREPD